jgi:hypothetical protein
MNTLSLPFFSPLALWERVGEREIRASSNTLIRLSGTFSQREKEFCKLPKERGVKKQPPRVERSI